jgi:hypothetical protein
MMLSDDLYLKVIVVMMVTGISKAMATLSSRWTRSSSIIIIISSRCSWNSSTAAPRCRSRDLMKSGEIATSVCWRI